MKKSVFSIVLTMLMLMSCVYAADTNIPPLPVCTEQSYEISVDLSADKLIKGDIVYIEIETDEPVDVYAFETKLEFDGDFLEYRALSGYSADDDDILIQNEDDNSLLIAYSKKGEQEAEKRTKICTIEFTSLKSGETVVSLNSVKLVMSDMTYYTDSESKPEAEVKISSKRQTTSSGGSSGGGGGRRPSGNSSGGGVKVSGGGVTSVGAEKPPEPEVTDTEVSFTESSFSDVAPTHWAFTFIENMTKDGIISGYGDNTFRPDKSISRAEFTKMIFAKTEIPTDTEQMFSDVDTDEWYYDIVNYAAAIGVVNGIGNGIFLPNDSISREEAAVIMMRYAEYLEVILLPERMNINFEDETDISDFAIGSIDALYTAEILSGSDDGRFYPKADISRAESAAALYNLFGAIVGEK